MIAIGITIYNPSTEQVVRINELSKKFKIYAFLNSDVCTPLDFSIENLGNKSNQGVSKALNDMMKKADADGFAYILFFDQDTSFDLLNEKSLNNLIKEFKNERLGAVGMKIYKNQRNDIITPYLITSGTVYSIKRSLSIGGFDERLFIDEVDIAHHHKLFRNGYFSLSLCKYSFEHPIGDTKSKVFFGQKISSSNHSPIRRYYMARNRLLTYRTYRENEVRNILSLMLIEPLRIVLVEKNKLKKLYYFLLGVLHYHQKKFHELRK